MDRSLTARALALLAAGSIGIHQLRYAIGFGERADAALAAHGHGYLRTLMPVVVTVLLVGFARLVTRLARGSRTRRPSSPIWVLWLGCVLVLASIYGLQESLEGAGALLGGGWIGLLLALPVGLLVALALRGSRAAEEPTWLVARLRIVAILAEARRSVDAATRPRAGIRRAGSARAPPATSAG